MMRIAEVIYSIPYLLVVILLSSVFQKQVRKQFIYNDFSNEFNGMGTYGNFG